MRVHGTLIKWNDAKGFGFVALPQTRDELFVHISAFPRDGVRPRIGETISFEVRTAPDGRKRAEAVERPASRREVSSKRFVPSHQRRSLRAVFPALVVLALGAVGYGSYKRHVDNEALLPASHPTEEPEQQFNCDGRTHCSQMKSCAEAYYFSKHCAGTKMDGDGDGDPCEQQCN